MPSSSLPTIPDALTSRLVGRRPVLAAAAASAALFGLSACSSSAEGAGGGTDGAVPETITIANHAIPNSLDPMKSASYEATQITFLWGGYLTNYGDADSGTPQLAESMTASADGMTWTVVLRSGLKFSDGSALGARDVVATLQRIMDMPDIGKDNFIGPAIGSIADVSAVDDTTVEITMSRVYPGLAAGLAAPEFVILPADGLADEKTFWEHPISAGRFQLDEIDVVNGNFSLTTNPNWYDTTPYKVKNVKFVAITDSATRLAQLKSGQVDYADNLPGNLLSQVTSPLSLDPAPWIGGQMALSVNFDDPVAGDERVRRAISLAVDRQQIAGSALGGDKVGLPLYGIPWTQNNSAPNAAAFEQDLTAAKAELAGTGYENGAKIVLVTVTDSAWQVPLVAQVVQEQLKAIGIDVQIENVTVAQVGDRLAQGNWGMFTRWIGYYESNQNYLGGYVYGDPTSGNNANFWGVPTHPNYPQLQAISDQIKTADQTQLPALIDQLNTEYAKVWPSIPLTTLSYVGGSRYSTDVIRSVGAARMVLA